VLPRSELLSMLASSDEPGGCPVEVMPRLMAAPRPSLYQKEAGDGRSYPAMRSCFRRLFLSRVLRQLRAPDAWVRNAQ
jgi:hypothetical protein